MKVQRSSDLPWTSIYNSSKLNRYTAHCRVFQIQPTKYSTNSVLLNAVETRETNRPNNVSEAGKTSLLESGGNAVHIDRVGIGSGMSGRETFLTEWPSSSR